MAYAGEEKFLDEKHDMKDSVLSKGFLSRYSSTSSHDDDLPQHAPPSYSQASSSQVSHSPVPNLIPNTSKILTIQATGTSSCWALPTPSNELEICIFDGTNTTTEPLYVSTRASRRSGNAVLHHSQRGELLATNYKFGPFREPVIRYLSATGDIKLGPDDEQGPLAVKTKSHMLTYRVDLTMAEHENKSFNWRYVRTPTPEGKKTRVLALTTETSGSSSGKDGTVIAVLLRTDSTRTPGTSKWCAGNGGQLILGSEAATHMDESLIVASCIMMLKKEIDRQRGAQSAAIAGAGS